MDALTPLVFVGRDNRMNRRSFGTLAASLLAAGFVEANVFSAPPVNRQAPDYITIYVSDMHCAGCCKKVSSKLYTIKDVIKVQTNLQKHFAIVVPKPGTKISPRKLWEAIEQVKMKPTKLVMPKGKQVYTAKPPAPKVVR